MDWTKIGIMSAIVGPVVFILLTLAAVANYPGYNIFNNFLSDLGQAESSAAFFRAAAIIAGLSAIILSAALYKIFSRLRCRTGSLTLTLAGIFLVAVGVFNDGEIHFIVSALFFAAASLALIVFGAGLRNRVGYFSVFMGILIPIFFSFGANPFPEHLAVAAIIVWSFGIGIHLKIKK